MLDKKYVKDVDVEAMLQRRAESYIDKAKYFLKSWYDPDDKPQDPSKKTYQALLDEADFARGDLQAFAEDLLVPQISRNLRDVLTVLYGIASPEVQVHDALLAFDRRMDMAKCGKWPEDGGYTKGLLTDKPDKGAKAGKAKDSEGEAAAQA